MRNILQHFSTGVQEFNSKYTCSVSFRFNCNAVKQIAADCHAWLSARINELFDDQLKSILGGLNSWKVLQLWSVSCMQMSSMKVHILLLFNMLMEILCTVEQLPSKKT